jgi:uncharacterized protein (TIGR00369 family)
MTDTGPTAAFDWADIEAINGQGSGSLHHRMGILITEVTPERVVGTMPVEGNTQPFGLLHGGASVVLAEGLGSILSTLLAGPGRMAVGVDINATHHRPAFAGTVTGVATPLSVGRTMASVQVELSDEHGNRTCTCRLTTQLRDVKPAPR